MRCQTLKLWFSSLVFLGFFTLSHASFVSDVWNETKFTLFQSITPLYFYDLTEQGKDDLNKGGGKTSIFEYRFFTTDIGWLHRIDTTKETGTVMIGGSVHIDRLITQFAPTLSETVQLILPDSTRKLWDKIEIGLGYGHDFDKKVFRYGFYSGVRLEF